MDPLALARQLRQIASSIDASSKPVLPHVVSDLKSVLASLEDPDFDPSKIREEPRYVVYWDWNQSQKDSYLDFHEKMPDDPTHFFNEDNGMKPSKTREDALKFVKKNKIPGIEGKDWMIVETMYEV